MAVERTTIGTRPHVCVSHLLRLAQSLQGAAEQIGIGIQQAVCVNKLLLPRVLVVHRQMVVERTIIGIQLRVCANHLHQHALHPRAVAL